MTRDEVMAALNDVFPAVVTSKFSWTFVVETQPLHVLTIASEFAANASTDTLKKLIQGMPPGDFLITSGGDLVIHKPSNQSSNI